MVNNIIEKIVTKKIKEDKYEFFRKQLATPEILPCPFDVTIDGWLARLDLWGDVLIEYKNNTDQKKWKKLKESEFIKKIYNKDDLQIFGKWQLKKELFNVVSMSRYYIDSNNKKCEEIFKISIDIKKKKY